VNSGAFFASDRLLASAVIASVQAHHSRSQDHEEHP
jgi:hypothetical protein